MMTEETNHKKLSILSIIKRSFQLRAKESMREVIEDLLEDQDIESAQEISAHEKKMLSNILFLRDKKCSQIMTARANIFAFQKDGSISNLAKEMIEKGHSRMPIYDKNLDDIVSVLHIIDVARHLITEDRNNPVATIINNGVKFVSPSIRVPDLLLEMQNEKIHMAIVVDEYGGVDGLLTIEDLLEEIVGEIEDEYDVNQNSAIKIHKDNNIITTDAAISIEEIDALVDMDITEGVDIEELEIDTIGGLILHYTQSIPKKGEVIKTPNGINFRIIEATPRKVKKVMIILPKSMDRKQ